MSKEADLDGKEHDLEEQPGLADDLLNAGGKKPSHSTLFAVALVASFLVICAVVVPNFMRARAGGRITSCLSNLKNIGTACEMYSTDYSGKYPPRMELLVPNYLKTLPECPATGSTTYKLQTGLNVGYNSIGAEDYYFISCHGANHEAIGIPPNYPQYDGIQGLIERP